jgi:hypothetical protein
MSQTVREAAGSLEEELAAVYRTLEEYAHRKKDYTVKSGQTVAEFEPSISLGSCQKKPTQPWHGCWFRVMSF